MKKEGYKASDKDVTILYGLFWVHYDPHSLGTFKLDIQTPVWEAKMEEDSQHELKVVELRFEDDGDNVLKAENTITMEAFNGQKFFNRKAISDLVTPGPEIVPGSVNRVALFHAPEEALEWAKAQVLVSILRANEVHTRMMDAIQYHTALLDGMVYDETEDLIDESIYTDGN